SDLRGLLDSSLDSARSQTAAETLGLRLASVYRGPGAMSVVIRTPRLSRGPRKRAATPSTLSAPSLPHRGIWQDPCRSVPCTHPNRSSTSAHRELIDVRRWPGRRSFRTRDRSQVIPCSCCL